MVLFTNFLHWTTKAGALFLETTVSEGPSTAIVRIMLKSIQLFYITERSSSNEFSLDVHTFSNVLKQLQNLKIMFFEHIWVSYGNNSKIMHLKNLDIFTYIESPPNPYSSPISSSKTGIIC